MRRQRIHSPMRLPCFLPSVPYLSPSPARISGKSEPILSVAQRTTAGKYVHREGASDKARFRLAHDWPTTGRQLADDVAVLRGACYYNWHVTKVVRGLKNATKFLSIMSMVAIYVTAYLLECALFPAGSSSAVLSVWNYNSDSTRNVVIHTELSAISSNTSTARGRHGAIARFRKLLGVWHCCLTRVAARAIIVTYLFIIRWVRWSLRT